MKKASPSKATAGKAREVEPFEKRAVRLSKLQQDIAPSDWNRLLGSRAGVVLPPFLQPFETLGPTKTVGRGRTNTTIVASTIVQTDATTPTAGFDRQLITFRDPAVQVHFAPAAYGITTVSTVVVSFLIQVDGTGTFLVRGGVVAPGTVENEGTKSLSGLRSVSVVLKNIPIGTDTFAFVQQTAGARWSWLSTQFSFPPPILTPV